MRSIGIKEAKTYMLGQMRLNDFGYSADLAGHRQLLGDLRCIQLDPLSPMGTSTDLVALARIEDYRHDDLFRTLLPGSAFEHFAKERCLLPAAAFPYYRDRAAVDPWGRLHKQHRAVPDHILEAVLEEVTRLGPVKPAQLSDHGRVKPVDWSGWKGTSKASTMALEILWTRCQLVVAGRSGRRDKRYDIPRRALPENAAEPGGPFERWALLQRVEAAGLLSRKAGPHWSMLTGARTSGLIADMLAEGLIEEVTIHGDTDRYLAPVDFLDRIFGEPDPHMRILAPLDPLIWNRRLVQHLFDFEYVWEVYKPAAQRRWGWYVCPLLHHGNLVGRLEGRAQAGVLNIETIWQETGQRLDRRVLDRALSRLAAACGASDFQRPKKFRNG